MLTILRGSVAFLCPFGPLDCAVLRRYACALLFALTAGGSYGSARVSAFVITPFACPLTRSFTITSF